MSQEICAADTSSSFWNFPVTWTWAPPADAPMVTFGEQFLPRDASAERGDATVSRLSVCLSVCLSVRP